MSMRVADIEWSTPLLAFDCLGSASGVLALVRRHGRPVGFVRVNAIHGAVTPDMLHAAIEAQVGPSDVSEAESITLARPVSIIVCTRERPDLLRACLEALRPQAARGHQVIIVDNAPSCDATAVLVSQYPYQYVSEPTPGLNVARNRGVAVARHDIVAFTDDDCAPDPAWLRALTAPFADPLVGAATGLVMPLELETRAQERFEIYCANRRIFQQRSFRAPQTPPSTAGVAGMGANMAIRRALLQQIGGFDIRFDGGTPTLSGGDTEMFARLLAAGTTIVYCPDALVWHRHCRDMDRLRRVIFGYGVGLYAVLTKRLIEDRDWGVLLTAPRWLVGPWLKATWNRIRRRPTPPLDLLWIEMWGAFNGPLRYRTVRHLAHSTITPEVEYAHGYMRA
jgi:GT2 family glycosyltransferase